MGHIENALNVVENEKRDLKIIQAAFNSTPRSGGRNNIFARQSAELAGRVVEQQERLVIAEQTLAAARLTPDEIIIQEEPLSDLPIQEQLILQVPIRERVMMVTPTNGIEDNTLRNALIVGGIIALVIL